MERDIHDLLKITQKYNNNIEQIKDMFDAFLKSQDEKMFYKDRVLCDKCSFQSKKYSSCRYIRQYKEMSRDQQRQEDANREYIFDSCKICNPEKDKMIDSTS
jgi:hypothetical protein